MSQLPFPFSSMTPTQPQQQNAMPVTNTAAPQSVPQAQQMAFMQNAQLPGIDMNALLQSIPPEHLAAIGQLYQAGLIPLPTAQNGAPSQTAPASTVNQNGAMAEPKAQQEDVDKEEGEWEDGEVAPQSEPDFLRPPPTGPRKRSGSIHARQDYRVADKRPKRQPSPRRQTQSYDRRQPPRRPSNDLHKSSPARSHVRQRKIKHDASKDFIVACHRAGYTFDDLAREVGDAKMLEILFKELGLAAQVPKPQAVKQPAKQPVKQPVKQPAKQPAKQSPATIDTSTRQQPASTIAKSAAATPVKGSPLAAATAAKRAVPATTAPAPDRLAYLAKLKAAKNKKNEASPVSPSTTAKEAPKPIEVPPVQQPAPSSLPAAEPIESTLTQSKKHNVSTELIRKRLEAFKAEQARKQEAERLASVDAASKTSAPPVSLASNSTGGVLPGFQFPVTESAQLPASAAYSAKPPPAVASTQPFGFTPQFPGLPGLFMTGSVPQSPAAAYKTPAPHAPQAPLETPTAPTSQLATPAAPNAHLDASVEFDSLATPAESGQVTGASSMSPPAERKVAALAGQNSAPVRSGVPSSGQATPKYPFNQNRHGIDDEPVIIQDSDEDESELDDDDMDEDSDIASAQAPTPVNLVQSAVAKPGPLRNLPMPTASAIMSAPSTPGATTPGTTAYQRKMLEIDEMNKRIAQMQSKSRTKPSTPVATNAIPATSNDLPKHGNPLHGLPGIGETKATPNAAVPQPAAQAMTESSQQQMEDKLAQLKEEATTISEQKAAAQANAVQSRPSLQTESVDVPMATDSDVPMGEEDNDDDDDEDAMDTSSGSEMDISNGSDSDPDDNDDDVGATTSNIIPEAPANGAQRTTGLATNDSMDVPAQEDSETASSDSDDSSSDSDEESDDDYEPAPAASDAALPSSTTLDAEPTADFQPAPTSGVEVGPSSTNNDSQPANGPQDIDHAIELQPPKSNPDAATPETASKHHFKSYESPLRMFKDYRFHPQFASDISGGYKSLTYSNKLDPMDVMCPAELSDGSCGDSKCIYQHFRTTSISDADLLKELGTRNAPWKTKEEKVRWAHGLSDLVKQLRASKQGDDVHAIAASIARYRREFIGVPDQIVSLNRV